MLQLDLALSDYGPEAKDVGAQLGQGPGKTIDEIWGSNESDANFVANNFAAAIHNLRSRERALAALYPGHSPKGSVVDAALRGRDSERHKGGG